jgi:hypothetical protein
MYFSLKSIPELKNLTVTARTVAWFACVHHTFRHWEVWALSVTSLTCFAIPFFFDEEIIFYVCAALALVFTFAFGQVQYSKIRPYLRAYLEQQKKHENS